MRLGLLLALLVLAGCPRRTPVVPVVPEPVVAPTAVAGLEGPALLVLEATDEDCAVVERSAVELDRRRELGTLGEPCPTRWQVARNDAGHWLLTVGGYREGRGFRVDEDGARPVPAPPGLERLTWDGEDVLAWTDGPDDPPDEPDAMNGSVRCRTWRLVDGGWVEQEVWIEELYEGMDTPWCGSPDVGDIGGTWLSADDESPTGAGMDAVLAPSEDRLSTRWLKTPELPLVWRTHWFEGERWLTPLAVPIDGVWTEVPGLGEQDQHLSLTWVGERVLACTRNRAVLLDRGVVEPVWRHEGVCPMPFDAGE